MALDKDYFDDISIEIVKKKYYNANKVDRLLADIRRQALALTEENRQLRQRLEALSGQKDEIGETLLSAKTIARQMVEDASRKARETETEAEEKAEKTLQEAAAQAVETVRAAENEAAQRLAEANAQAQQALSDAEAQRSALEEGARRDRQRAQQSMERLCGAVKELLLGGAEQVDTARQAFLDGLDTDAAEPEEIPADLGEKVSAIAQLLELDTDEGDEEQETDN